MGKITVLERKSDQDCPDTEGLLDSSDTEHVDSNWPAHLLDSPTTKRSLDSSDICSGATDEGFAEYHGEDWKVVSNGEDAQSAALTARLSSESSIAELSLAGSLLRNSPGVEEEDGWQLVRARGARPCRPDTRGSALRSVRAHGARVRRPEERLFRHNTEAGISQLCLWGEEGDSRFMWQRVEYLSRDSTVVHRILKAQRVQQENGQIRFDIWVDTAYVDTILSKLRRGTKRYQWYVRQHIPYLKRVEAGRDLQGNRLRTGERRVRFAEGAPHVIPSPAGECELQGHTQGVDIVVGTLNINGVMRKRTDLRVLLEESRCDIMGLQETLLRASDWNLRVPGYRCLVAMGDQIASQRGVGLLVSAKWSCCPVGRSNSYSCWGRVFGQGLNQPFIAGSIYVPQREGREGVLRDLPGVIASMHREYPNDPIILTGDLNMDITHAQTWLATTHLPFEVIPTEGQQGTRRSRRSNRSRQIDFICYYGVGTTSPARVLTAWDISDHYPVLANIKMGRSDDGSEMATNTPPQNSHRRIQVETPEARLAVATSNRWAAFATWIEELEAELSSDEEAELTFGAEAGEPSTTVPAQHMLNNMADRFISTCHQIADDLDSHQSQKGQNPPRVIGAVKRAIHKRRKSFQHLRLMEKNGIHTEIDTARSEYMAQTKRAKKRIRFYGRRAWHRQIALAHFNMCNRPHTFWRWASNTAGWRAKNSLAKIQPIMGTNGRLLTAIRDILQAWQAHYQTLASDPTGNSQDPSHWQHIYEDDSRPHLTVLDDRIDNHEVWSAVTKMATHRAPGNDGIPTEFLKAVLIEKRREEDIRRNKVHEAPNAGRTPITDGIRSLLNFAYEKGLVAEQWAESIVVSIPKKGDLSDMDNYRGISLMPTILKVMCVILNARINKSAEERGLFSRSQAGFRTREECVTQVACVVETIQRRRICGRPTYVVFVDLKKAYDTVPHEGLFAKLYRFGIRGRCLNFLRSLYRSSTIRVRIGGGDDSRFAEPVRLLRGVRQGCPLSPTLFNIFIDDLTEGTMTSGVTVPTGNSKTWRQSDLKIGCTLFADDAAGLAPNLPQAQRFCDHVTAWVTTNEMQVGISKCGIMEFLPDTAHSVLTEASAPVIAGQRVPVVQDYLYLGIKLTKDLEINAMIGDRVRQGMVTLQTVTPFLRCPAIPLPIRRKIVSTVLLPRLLYGAELYGMNRRLTDRMQAILNKALRDILTGPGSDGRFGSIGLWKEMAIDPICALAAARRTRAWGKARSLRTWLSEIVLHPFKSRYWTWSSGVETWIQRFALPHLTPATLAAHPDIRTEWRTMEPRQLSGIIAACIKARETGIRLKPDREAAAHTQWYESGNFTESSLTTGNIQCTPLQTIGLAWVTRLRVGAFISTGTLAEWGRIPREFIHTCPFCRTNERETIRHLVFDCEAWAEERHRPSMHALVNAVNALSADAAGDGDRLTWILGGISANRRVAGWMPGATIEPLSEDANASYDSDDVESTSTVSVNSLAALAAEDSPRRWRSPGAGNGGTDHGDEPGAIALAHFLKDVTDRRSGYMRSRWSSHLQGAASAAVRPTSTGQRPAG